MKKTILFFYITTILLLGIRPKVNFLRNNFLPESDIGGWCMYERYIEVLQSVYLLEGDEVNDLEWKRHLNHGGFGSSGHPHISKPVMRSFINYVVEQDSVVQSVLKDDFRKNKTKLIFEITKIVEQKDTFLIKVEQNLRDYEL